MRSKRTKDPQGLTEGIRERIAHLALERMEEECIGGFKVLSSFRTLGVRKFLAWMRSIEEPKRTEAALSRTCHHLLLRHIKCKRIPNLDRWVEAYRMFSSNLALDSDWRPKGHVKAVRAEIISQLGPIRSLGPQSMVVGDDGPLRIPLITTSFELSTKLADIVLLQFIPGDSSSFDVSYVSLLGLGQTGWRIYATEECPAAVTQVKQVALKAKEIVAR